MRGWWDQRGPVQQEEMKNEEPKGWALAPTLSCQNPISIVAPLGPPPRAMFHMVKSTGGRPSHETVSKRMNDLTELTKRGLCCAF